MTAANEHRKIWRDALQDDADRVWSGMQEEIAPPLRTSFRAPGISSAWRWLAVAAGIAAIGFGAWNVSLQRELSDTRAAYLVATLRGESSSRLATLHRLETVTLSDAIVEELISVVKESDDPNVQLAAIDILLDNRSLDDEERIDSLLDGVRHNRKFIEQAIRARSTRI